MTAVTDIFFVPLYYIYVIKSLINRIRIKNFSDIFSEEQLAVSQKLNQFQDLLKRLQYEGKLTQGKNIQTVEGVLETLKLSYDAHKKIDDEVIFPFLDRHIPRINPFLRLLTAERVEFLALIKDCEALLQKFKNSRGQNTQPGILDQLGEKGIYAIALIRNHIQMEMENVYKVIDKELRPAEKNQLAAAVKKYLSGINRINGKGKALWAKSQQAGK